MFHKIMIFYPNVTGLFKIINFNNLEKQKDID
jgi:hypothetical protein